MARDQNHKSFYTDENIKLRSPFQLLNTRNNFFRVSGLKHLLYGMIKTSFPWQLRQVPNDPLKRELLQAYI